jgi:hypothetical protein
MVHVKLISCDFEADIDETVLDDMEMVDRLIAFDRGDFSGLPELTAAVLGEHKQALYDALRDEKGRVPTQAFGAAFGEILREVLPKKS